MAIKCEGCRAYCCRVIGKLDPSLDRGDLCCKHLTEDYKCKIYEHRPLICDTDRLYNAFFKGIMSREEYDKLNADGCRKLRESNYSRKVEGEFK